MTNEFDGTPGEIEVTSDRGACAAPAEGILRCLYLGPIMRWPVGLVAVAVDLGEHELAEHIRTLRARGLLAEPESGYLVLPALYDWRAPLVSTSDPGHQQWDTLAYARLCGHLHELVRAAAPVLGRVAPQPLPGRGGTAGADLTGEEALARAAAYRCAVPGVITHATRLGWADDAAHLARAWWSIADRVADSPHDAWMRDLATAGETAGLRTQSPPVLTEVLDAAGTCAQRLDDRLAAEERWVHALSVWRFLDLPAPGVPLLEQLLPLYVRWHRWSRACDVLRDLVRVHTRLREQAQVSWAWTRLAVVMLRVHRPDASVVYAERAATLIVETALPVPDPCARVVLADLDILIGRARWATAHPGAARHAWHKALAQLVEVDERRAEHVRALLALGDTDPLPDDDVLDGILPFPAAARAEVHR